ncbi:MAG TPA: HD domain-containing protein [Dongiaceae bacterium]|jgi:phosphonate degradation associated HDIG domain protein|nr:HD domain-containing protein [Dongiaceae bacterium]
MSHSVVEEILALYARKGAMSYGEGVDMNAHALQAALLAEGEGAGAALVTAALLHDIGHLLHDLPEDIADQGIDTRHESIASAWLSQHFPPAVSEPVRLHVAAKRYLCAVEPGHLAALSPASVQSLALQGGPMSAPEAARFAAEPYAEQALRLRRWDDRAKQPALATPGFERYRQVVESSLKPDAASG